MGDLQVGPGVAPIAVVVIADDRPPVRPDGDRGKVADIPDAVHGGKGGAGAGRVIAVGDLQVEVGVVVIADDRQPVRPTVIEVNSLTSPALSTVARFELLQALATTVYRLPLTVHRLPFTVHRSPFTVHRLPLTVSPRLPVSVSSSPGPARCAGRRPTPGRGS